MATVSITSIASISPLGISLDEAWNQYLKPGHLLKKVLKGQHAEWVAEIPDTAKAAIEKIAGSDPKYKDLDRSVLFAMYASRKAVDIAGWEATEHFGINLGSSRGATALFEKYHEEFLLQKVASTLSSPTTTLGNLSSWVAHDLGTQGPEISHSITCSTALHALLNGIAWIQSGMADKFLVGGSESPLTPFTIAQMKALKIYARGQGFPQDDRHFPCRSLDFDKTANTLILGEGASIACLERGETTGSLALIEGVGYATEPLEHSVSLSTDAVCFQRSMQMALKAVAASDIDVIVMHAPGTIKGDRSEWNAIQKVFGRQIPAVTGNKWKIGHTFATSGMLSVEMAVLMLQNQKFIPVPFIEYQGIPERINRVMVNAVGFGGNAVSILLRAAPLANNANRERTRLS